MELMHLTEDQEELVQEAQDIVSDPPGSMYNVPNGTMERIDHYLDVIHRLGSDESLTLFQRVRLSWTLFWLRGVVDMVNGRTDIGTGP